MAAIVWTDDSVMQRMGEVVGAGWAGWVRMHRPRSNKTVKVTTTFSGRAGRMQG